MYKYIIWVCCCLGFLSACTPAAQSPSTALPTATTQREASPVVQTTTPIATLTPSRVPSNDVAVVTTEPVDALASQTSEGYYQIGNPDAPITMTDYSDFF